MPVRTVRRARRRDVVTAVLASGAIGTIGAGISAAVQAEPGPAVWKLLLFGILGVAVAFLIGVIACLAVDPEVRSVGEGRDLGESEGPLVLAFVGGWAMFLVGLFVPGVVGSDAWGYWLADLVGVL